MSDYTKSGKPLDGARNIAKVMRDEFTLIEAAVNSKSNENLFVLEGTEAQGATVNDYVVTVSPAITAYTTGSVVAFISTHANTGAVTLKVSALAAKTLKDVDGNALASGDIANGSVVAAYYNGTDFYMTSGNDRVARSGDTYTGTHDFTGATISSGQLDAKAPLASPALTGVPTAPTATAGTNTTQLATTAHVFAERANVATLTNKTLTTPVINGPTGIVKGDVGLGNVDNTTDAGKPISTATQTALDLKSPLASPTFTGIPAAPTAAPGTNTTQLATTAFVDAKAFSTALPSQTGNNGKFVTTDGSVASWASAATLGANTFTGAQILSDQQVSRAMLIDCGLTYLDLGNSGTTTRDLAYTGGSHQRITATGNFTITTSAWPPTGNLGVVLLEAANFGAFTVTWPTVNWVKPDGTTTTSVSTWLAAVTGRTAFQSSGTDFIKIWTRNAGTTIYGGFAA